MSLFNDILAFYRIELDDLLFKYDRKPNQDELDELLVEIKENVTELKAIKRRLNDVEASEAEAILEAVAREIKSSVVTVNKPGTLIKKSRKPSWINENRINKDEWHYWSRYKDLMEKQGRSVDSIKELEKSTLTITELLGDPRSDTSFFCKGVVVGNVQSGKTGNFNGVINRAIDLGYKLVIVFSGIMDDLRSQTQDRIEKDVIGWGTLTNNIKGGSGKKGVGNIRPFGGASGIFQVESITSFDSDFNRNLLDAGFSFANTKILVCKKNHSVLANLIYWIYTAIPEGQKVLDTPLLVLDDEADNASLNNLGYKGIQYAGKVNGHIRALLGLFSKKAYLGYTATPFANILQDQNEGIEDFWEIKYKRKGEEIIHRHALTKSLFPEDFIYKLNPPSNYVGPKLMFEHGQEEEGDRKLPILNIIDDYETYFPPKAKKNQEKPAGLPQSLYDAIDCFVLSIALRLSREKVLVNTSGFNPHHTMLVHVSLFTDWQNSVADKIDVYLKELQKEIADHKLSDSVFVRLEKQWNRFYAYEVENIKLHLPENYLDHTLSFKEFRKDICPLLPAAVKDIEIKAVNSERGQKLEYRTDNNGRGKKYIAVGGNRLSRGFTLEGLSINYFIRCTSYADTLLQMGRWFGYRPGYVDACKVFLDIDSFDKFNFITRTLTELDDRIEVMNREDLSPRQYAMRIRNDHDTLKITRPSIIKSAQTVRFTFREKLVETYKFKLDAAKMKRSWIQFVSLVNEFNTSGKFTDDKEAGFYKIRTDKEGLYRFLDNENSFISTDSFSMSEIKAYIDLAVDNGFLKNWTIAIQKNGRGNELNEPNSKIFENGKVRMSVRSGPKKPENPDKDAPKDYYNELLYNELLKDNIFHASSARIVTSGEDEAVNLPIDLKKSAIEEFRKNKTIELIDSGKYSDDEAREIAKKKTLPGSIFRLKRSSTEGLLLIYLMDINYIFNGDLSKKIEEEGFDKDVPLIGYAFSFPANQNDPGGLYLANAVTYLDEFPVGVNEEIDDLDFIGNLDEPVSVD